jgi:uncharacterized membrane protein YhhN
MILPVGLYSMVLTVMAVTASQSRFRGAALGAWLFVASDLFIFASLGPLQGSFLPDLLVWPLYFVGQAMIAWDVGRGLSPQGTVPMSGAGGQSPFGDSPRR